MVYIGAFDIMPDPEAPPAQGAPQPMAADAPLVERLQANIRKWGTLNDRWQARADAAMPSPGDDVHRLKQLNQDYHAAAQVTKEEHTAALAELDQLAAENITAINRLFDLGDQAAALGDTESARQAYDGAKALIALQEQMLEAAEAARLGGLAAMIRAGEILAATSQGIIDAPTVQATGDWLDQLLQELLPRAGKGLGIALGVVAVALGGLIAFKLITR